MIRGDALRAIIDQGLWAIRSLILVMLVARASSPDEFGLFALCLAALILLSGLGSSLSGEVLSVTRGVLARHNGVGLGADEIARSTARAYGVVVVAALVAPFIVFFVAFAFRGPVHIDAAIWVVVGGATLAVLAEGIRAVLYSLRLVTHSMKVSASWLFVQMLSSGVCYLFGDLGAFEATLCWLLGAGAATVAGLSRLPIMPQFRGASPEEWARRRQFCFEYIATTGPTQAMGFVAGSMLGLGAAGTVRALQSLYGPLNVLLAGMANAIIPAKAQDPSGARHIGAGLAGMALLVAASATAALVLFPGIGASLLGQSWPTQATLIVGYGVGRCAQGLVFGAMVVYRAHDGGWLSWRLRMATAIAVLVPFLVASFLSLEAGIWASSIGGLMAGGLWWVYMSRVTKDVDELSTRSQIV